MREGLENGTGKWRVEFFEKLEIDDTDTVTIGSEAIAAGFAQTLNEALGPEFGKVVSQGAECVLGRGEVERFGGVGVDFSGRETVLSHKMGKADQGMHQRAAALGEIIRGEDGVGRAVAFIQR